jgi:hypothetical protein
MIERFIHSDEFIVCVVVIVLEIAVQICGWRY